jgi:hypothetical protein
LVRCCRRVCGIGPLLSLAGTPELQRWSVAVVPADDQAPRCWSPAHLGAWPRRQRQCRPAWEPAPAARRSRTCGLWPNAPIARLIFPDHGKTGPGAANSPRSSLHPGRRIETTTPQADLRTTVAQLGCMSGIGCIHPTRLQGGASSSRLPSSFVAALLTRQSRRRRALRSSDVPGRAAPPGPGPGRRMPVRSTG